jgi:undecaprenyl-diphosphatase
VDPHRRLAWLLAASTVPAAIVGFALNDLIETAFREPRLVAITLVAGGVILWLADRLGSRTRAIDGLTFRAALGIGAAQALALIPGVSRSGISISAGLFAGLSREDSARYAFLMATPITAGAGLWEARKILAGEAGIELPMLPLLAGMLASLVAGLLAIAVLMRFLRSHGVGIFVLYRLALAAVVVVAWLNLWDR